MKARLLSKIPALKDVVSYQGEAVEELLGNVLTRYPSVAMIYRGGPWEPEAHNVYAAKRVFQLIIVVESLRGDLSRRAGNADEAGAYEVVEDVERALVGQTLGLEIDPLMPVDTQNLWTAADGGAGLSIYGLELHTGWEYEVQEEDGETITGIHGDFTPSDTVTESVTIPVEES